MKAQKYPAGVYNNQVIREITMSADRVVATWGNFGSYIDRGEEVKRLISDIKLLCLRITKHGSPFILCTKRKIKNLIVHNKKVY
jgi:hypothetical protein